MNPTVIGQYSASSIVRREQSTCEAVALDISVPNVAVVLVKTEQVSASDKRLRKYSRPYHGAVSEGIEVRSLVHELERFNERVTPAV